jgi:gliding motility-associated-like protein
VHNLNKAVPVKINFIIVFLSLVMMSSCKKDSAPSVHCANLLNDLLPSSDSGALFIVSAFTPNGDGINDGFRIFHKDIASISIKMYDKNSQVVFESSQLNAVWTPILGGKKFEQYFFRIEAITQNNNRIGKCGVLYALSCIPSGMLQHSFTFEDQFDSQTGAFALATSETLATCN